LKHKLDKLKGISNKENLYSECKGKTASLTIQHRVVWSCCFILLAKALEVKLRCWLVTSREGEVHGSSLLCLISPVIWRPPAAVER